MKKNIHSRIGDAEDTVGECHIPEIEIFLEKLAGKRTALAQKNAERMRSVLERVRIPAREMELIE